MNYTYPILMAIICFPVLSIILSLPFFVYYYRKYGAISFFRGLLFFSFFFYLLCAYFLVILPLPSISSVSSYTGAYYNLKPFYFIPDFITSDVFNVKDFNTYFLIFKNSRYLEAIFNILLVIPFGVYLRYYFKCGFFKTFILSFLLTLFFELTQLSGLYFIYPRPYRLFDINDLINNTLGGIIGYFITPILSFFLPSRDKIDINDYIKGVHVSIFRRGVGLIIDYILVFSLSFGVSRFFGHFLFFYLLISFLYFVFIPFIFVGYSFGKWIVKYRTIRSDGCNIGIMACLFKYLFIDLFIINGPFLIYFFYNRGYYVDYFTLFYIIITFLFFVHVFYCWGFNKKLFFDKLFKLDSISTISGDFDEI